MYPRVCSVKMVMLLELTTLLSIFPVMIRRQKKKFGKSDFTSTADFDGEEVHLTSEDEDLMILYLESVKENKRRQY